MKQLLLLLPALLTGVVALPLLGKEQCAKGPEIWCQNIHTASQCGAVNHCQQMVWNKPTVKTLPCEICKEVLNVLKLYLKDKQTEIIIVEYFDKLCEFFPKEASVCKDYVNQYLSLLLDMLKKELDDPSATCSALGLCKSLQQHLASVNQHQQLQSNEIPEVDMSQVVSPFLANVPLLLYPQEMPEQKFQGDDKICKDCVQFLTDFQEAVRTNSSFVDITIAQIKKGCDELPPGIVDMCKSYITQYSAVVIQLVMLKKPVELCCMGGFCPALKSVPLQTLVPAKVHHSVKEDIAEKNNMLLVKLSPECIICELLMKELDKLLENNRTEESIKQALDRVCSFLPKPTSEQCMDFVNIYTDFIIKILLEEASPGLVCSTLGCCPKNKLFLVERITPEQLRSGEFCTVCKLIVNYIDILLEKNATQEKIENALHKVCNFLQSSAQEQCNQLVTQYYVEILQLLLQIIDPEFVCSKLHTCVSVKKPMLGSEDCVWGPGYWCKSIETAARCNAVEHCKRHVWN